MPWSKEWYQVSTGNVADAAKEEVRIMDGGIQALSPNMKILGPAYPIECSGGNNLAIIQALSSAPEGCVLVINVHGHTETGHFGDLLTNAAQARGVLGAIIDGACRDVDEILKLHFPVFCRGACPRGPLRLKNGTINQTTDCGGIVVNPGDIVFADASGVVVFPKASARTILEKAKTIANREIDVIKQLKQKKSLIQILKLDTR